MYINVVVFIITLATSHGIANASLTHLGTLHVSDPLPSLVLRVDDERPACAASDDDSVFSAEGVCWQALDVPLPYGRRVTQELHHTESGCERHLCLLHLVTHY